MRPRWAADGGNGSVVAMDSTQIATARPLMEYLLQEVDLLCPDVPDYVIECVCVQFTATLIELQESARALQ